VEEEESDPLGTGTPFDSLQAEEQNESLLVKSCLCFQLMVGYSEPLPGGEQCESRLVKSCLCFLCVVGHSDPLLAEHHLYAPLKKVQFDSLLVTDLLYLLLEEEHSDLLPTQGHFDFL
jgi:hypothetical protein